MNNKYEKESYMKNLKSLFRRNTRVNSSLVLLLAAAFFFLLSNQGICQNSPAALVIYPAPSGAPMASGVTVTANGQSVPVYSFPIRPETPGQGGRFCQFDFSDSVTIFVSPVAEGTVVRPAFANLNPVYENGGVSITLRKPQNIHIVGVVAVFANPMEVNPPKQGDPGVIYFGPGMASAGTITLTSNQTLYLAGGAYVNANVKSSGANNVKIMGRGILYRTAGDKGLGGYGSPQIALDSSTNTLIEGIVHLNAVTHGWSGRHTGSKGMKFINFKNLGAADYSTDGHNIHNCSDVLYDNCFFICDDDNIAIKGFNFSKPCENITIQNSLLYNSNGTCITYGAESKASYYRNITVRNCDLYHDERYGGEPGKGAMAIQCRYGVRYSNLRYENITVNTSHNLINLFFTESLFAKNNGDQSTPGEIDSVWFNNITATGTGAKSIVLQGWDSTKMVKNVQFSNLVIDNKPVTSLTEPYFQLNNFTENITIVDRTKRMTALAQKTLAPTPPMGWNSWNTFKKEINEQLFIESAEVLLSSGLADAGYVYVNIDDGWSGEEANVAIAEKFPKGIGYLADYMHQRNLKLGLYTNWRSLGKVERDVKQWAEWNIDLIKNDAWKTPSTDPHWAQMQNALLKTGKPIVHSIHFSDEDSNPSNICEISNMWRITNDIQDYYNHESIPDDKKSWAYSTLDIIDRMAEITQMIKPGCWADVDMLEIGNGNQTVDEYKTQFTMWCLLPAPLIMGNDIRTMNDETKAILMNKEAIAINQDPAVIPAKRIRKDDNTELWSRKLADGSLCVVLLQKTKTQQTVEFTWEEIGLAADQPASVHDLWQHKPLGVFTKRFSIPVNAHGCAMLKITQDKTK